MKCIRKTIILRLIILFGMCLTSVTNTFADWVNVTGAANSPNIAEVHIEKSGIKLILEIDPNDLGTFTKTGTERHFNLPLFVVNGKMLQGSQQTFEKRQRIERNSKLPSFTGKPPSAEVYYLEVLYPFAKIPEKVEILAPQSDQGVIAAMIGFVVFHEEIPVIDFRYLPKKSILYLNWKDPWYSAFEHRNLTRHHKFPLMSFLYIEPFEVRHEFLIRLKDLQPWIKFNFADKKILNPQDQDHLKKSIGNLVLKHNPILISGQRVQPVLERVEFVKASREGIRIRKETASIAVNTATIGVILSYATQGIPKNVTMTWDLFNDKITRIPLRIEDPAGATTQEITPQDNTNFWKNRLKNYVTPEFQPVQTQEQPHYLSYILFLIGGVVLWLSFLPPFRFSSLVSLGQIRLIFSSTIFLALITVEVFYYNRLGPLRGESAIPKSQEKSILTALLKNTYRALELKDDEAIYDHLVISVAGDFLHQLYLQRKRTLKFQNQEDVSVKLKELQVTSAELEKRDPLKASYTFRCKWNIVGSLGHWGHLHTRRNSYEAMVTIKPIDQTWKITDIKWIVAEKVAPS